MDLSPSNRSIHSWRLFVVSAVDLQESTEDRMLSGAMIFAFQAPAAVAMADLFAKEPGGGRFPLPCAKELGNDFMINQYCQSFPKLA